MQDVAPEDANRSFGCLALIRLLQKHIGKDGIPSIEDCNLATRDELFVMQEVWGTFSKYLETFEAAPLMFYYILYWRLLVLMDCSSWSIA